MPIPSFTPSRRELCGMLAAATLLPLAGCAKRVPEDPHRGSAPVEVPAEPKPLAVGITAPASLDPARAATSADWQVVSQLFDPLMRYDYEAGALACCACRSVETSEDARTFTFTLRTAAFHNGEPVRAADFKRAWERLARPQGAVDDGAAPSVRDASGDSARSMAFLLSLVEGFEALCTGGASELAGVSCPDDRTLVVRLSRPYADFPFIAAHPCLAPIPAAADVDAEAFARAPIGNGAFKLSEEGVSENGDLVLIRFEGHPSATPALEQVAFVACEDERDAYDRLEEGSLDVCACPFERINAKAASWKVAPGQTAEAHALARGRAQVLQPEPAVSFLVCNTEVEPLADPQFRRALSLAIDAEGLVKSVFDGAWMPARGIVPPCVHGYDAEQEGWAFSSYDAQASSELLDGLHPMGEEGARGVGVTLTYSADGGQKRAMEAVAANLEAVGIACELEAVPFEELVERYRSGDFELGRFDGVADVPCMDALLRPLFHSSNIGSHNLARYANPEVDELLDEARATVDEEVRLALLRQAAALIGRDCPVIPYAYPSRAHVGSQRVGHLPVAADGILRLADAEMAE